MGVGNNKLFKHTHSPGGSRKRARSGAGGAQARWRRKKKRFSRVAQSVSDSERSSEEGVGVG